MAITSRDQLIDALGNRAQHFVISKASIASQVAGGYCAMWRSAGIPAQGAIPGAAAICAEGLAGGFIWSDPTGGQSSYLARMMVVNSVSGTDVQIHDRLAHMGGLSGTVTTAQTVGVDVSVSTSNMDDRRGAADYSDVQWWLEWYTATGATAVTATVTYTNAAGTSGRTTTVALTATMGASRRLPIIGNGGEFIRSIQSVTLSATTGTAGNFGVTATRAITGMPLGFANAASLADWAALGLPRVPDMSCLEMMVMPGSTSSGTLYGSAKLIQG